MKPARIPYSFQSLQTESWENRKKNSKRNSPRFLSVVPGWERKVKIHTVLSFQIQTGKGVDLYIVACVFFRMYSLAVNSFWGKAIAFLFVLSCALRTFLGKLQTGDPQNIAVQKYRFHSTCTYGPTNYWQLSRKLSFFFKIYLEVALGLGGLVCFAPSLGMPLALFNNARYIYSLSQLKPDKIFESFIFA